MLERKIKELEGRWQRKTREKRKRNIVVKAVKITGGKEREAVKKIIKDTGAEVKIEEIRRLRESEEEGTDDMGKVGE